MYVAGVNSSGQLGLGDLAPRDRFEVVRETRGAGVSFVAAVSGVGKRCRLGKPFSFGINSAFSFLLLGQTLVVVASLSSQAERPKRRGRGEADAPISHCRACNCFHT